MNTGFRLTFHLVASFSRIVPRTMTQMTLFVTNDITRLGIKAVDYVLLKNARYG
jgi:hypothetical protein